MSGVEQGTIRGATVGGLAGTHPDVPLPPALAGPATADERNTLRPSIVALACWKIEDLRFDFGSSVILPEAKDELPLLAALIDEHTEKTPGAGQGPAGAARPPRASIFGHADPVGDDDFNKRLSGRRAAAVYGMLTRRDEVWEDLFSSTGRFAPAAAGDTWGIRSLQIMLNEMPADDPAAAPDRRASDGASGGASGLETDADGFPRGLDPTEDLGPGPPDEPDRKDKPKLLDEPLAVNGVLDDATRAAIKRFQGSARGRAAGLVVNGEPDQPTRRALFLAYMDVVCVNEQGRPFSVDRVRGFLGRGEDPRGKCDFQGCSEFNPLMVFSRKERAAFDAARDKTERNAENAVNRRVLVLLFRPAVKVSSGFWPCPRAIEGTAGCKKRFWSDGERRRSPADERREFADTQDTFACRFYHRMTTGSPCEKSLPGPRVLLKLQIHDIFYKPCRNEAVTVTGEGGFFERGQTDGDGLLTLKVPGGLTQVVVRYAPKDLGIHYAVTAALVPPDRTDDASLLAHIRNFGFGRDDREIAPAVVKFQAARGELDLTGTLDAATKQAVRELLAAALENRLGANGG
jgi:hypothetical protein